MWGPLCYFIFLELYRYQYFDKTVRMTLSRKSEAVNFINSILKLKGKKELLENYVRNITKITLGREKAEELIKEIINEGRKGENTMLANVIRDTWNSGEKAGIVKGVSKGEKSGRRTAKIEIAKNLHRMQMPKEKIAKAINTTMAELEKMLSK